jgi:hypothetical protein
VFTHIGIELASCNRYGMATCLKRKKTMEGRLEVIGGKEERGTFCKPDPELGNLYLKN